MKKDATTLLRNELEKTKIDVVALGGVRDSYQPSKRKYKITRRILEVLRDNQFPVHIITKSDLVLRDVDILREISTNSWRTVSFTIITFEKEMLCLLEPFAPPPEKGLEAMRQINEAGVQAGVDFTPIVPLILDSDVNTREAVGRAPKRWGEIRPAGHWDDAEKQPEDPFLHVA